MLLDNMSRKILAIFGILILIQLYGCATIFTGTTDKIKFDANISGVRLSIDGQYKGELPQTVIMSRNFLSGQQFKAKFEAKGYKTQEFTIKREFNTIAILDVSSTLTSGGIDLLTGSLMRFSPNEYHIQMLKKGDNPDSAANVRSKRLYQLALVNYQNILRDISYGGGEYLSSFAFSLSDNSSNIDFLIINDAIHNAPELLMARNAHDFIHRFNNMLARDSNLMTYQM